MNVWFYSCVDCNEWNIISALRFSCMERLLGDCCFCSDAMALCAALLSVKLSCSILHSESLFLSFSVEVILAFFANPRKISVLGKTMTLS